MPGRRGASAAGQSSRRRGRRRQPGRPPARRYWPTAYMSRAVLQVGEGSFLPASSSAFMGQKGLGCRLLGGTGSLLLFPAWPWVCNVLAAG